MARKSRRNIADTGDSALTPTEKIYNTAIYARLSVEDSGKNDNGDSIDNQVYLTKQYINERPYLNLCGTFIDNGETGTNFNRPSFNELMEEVKMGRIDCIIVKDLSRFGRNYIETGNYLERVFPFLGVRFISVNDNYDTNNPESNSECLAIALKSLINDVYAKDISRKTSAALQSKQKNGEFIGAYASYGYLKSSENKHKIVIDEETAPVVRNIFKWITEGMGYTAIARRLNDVGIPSPKKYRYEKGILKDKKCADYLWTERTVKDILKNPVYLGCMVQGKTKTRFTQGLAQEIVSPESWIIVENTHEPIIDRDTFDKVQEIIKEKNKAYYEKARTYADKDTHENIFLKIISCGDCGANLTRYRKVKAPNKRLNKPEEVYYRFICPNYARKYKRTCKHRKAVIEAVLIETVWNAVRTEIDLSVDTERLALKMQNSSGNRARAKTIKEQIAEANRKIERITNLSTNLYSDYADAILSETEYIFAKAKYTEERMLWEQRLNELISEEAKQSDAFVYDNKWISALAQFRESKTLTREMLLALVERVIVSGDNEIEIIFKHRDEYEALKLHIGESEVEVSA